MMTPPQRQTQRANILSLLCIVVIWFVAYFLPLRTEPLMDDADATHAQAAQAMLSTGDLVTLHVNGVRYLEKPPLPYWIAAASIRLFGANAFAVHLPQALTVLALALLAWHWTRRAFSQRAALLAALFLLTTDGVFLFTRIFIPDALLSLLLALALYSLARTADDIRSRLHPWTFWIALALAVLAKGLVALVLIGATLILLLVFTRPWKILSRLRIVPGLLLMLAIAAPWHVLAGLRNTGGAGGHGFFWFYFVNEHWLRFLGQRIPRDYNKLPTALYWLLHLLWLYPWSLFAPAALLAAWQARQRAQHARELTPDGSRISRHQLIALAKAPRTYSFAENTVCIALLFTTITTLFFSLSTNQEYYTFPVYLPVLMLTAAALTTGLAPRRAITSGFAALMLLCTAAAIVLFAGLWQSRKIAPVTDIGTLIAHRAIGGYTLSLSRFFDLTGPSFAALRLPATLAAVALVTLPLVALALHLRRKTYPALFTIALAQTVFLIAAHLALVRFSSVLSSQDFAQEVQRLRATHFIEPDTTIALFGDQAYGSSIPFTLGERVQIVDGRTTSMYFGSTFLDCPPVFVSAADYTRQWGTGPRKVLFVPLERRADAEHLLPHSTTLYDSAGKLLLTDRPLATQP